MKTSISIAWLLIFAIMAFDVWFAWHFALFFQDFELNPLARHFGLVNSLLFRMATVCVACPLILSMPERKCVIATTVVLVVHMLLLAWYVVSCLS